MSHPTNENKKFLSQLVAILPVSYIIKGEFPEALQKGKICLLAFNEEDSDYPDNRKSI